MPQLPISSPLRTAAFVGVPCLALAAGAVLLLPRATPEKSSAPVPAAEMAAAKAVKKAPVNGSVRIGLRSISGRTSVGLRAATRGQLLNAAGKKLRSLPADKPIWLTADFSEQKVRVRGPGFEVSEPEVVLAASRLRIGDRRYPGRVRVRLSGTGLSLINELDIEQYLEGVLPGELPRGFGMEAQKAQAVAARTYALVQRGKHGEYDLCDITCCQMYLGQSSHSRRGLAAVRATARLCLWQDDELAYTFYSADCGGISTRVEDVPLKDKPEHPLPYLTVVKDAPARGADYCASSPFHQWTRRVSWADLESRLNAWETTYIGKLRGVEVAKTDDSGRVTEIRLTGFEAPVESTASAAGVLGGDAAAEPKPVERVITGWSFRNAVGARTLLSTLFQIDASDPQQVRFQGRGNGHGLGLCQIGANGMSGKGASFREILAHYYPGTRLEKVAR
ncbi:MAG: SpoIID/LytB domain-containing protein [Armatimonadota bacterium]